VNSKFKNDSPISINAFPGRLLKYKEVHCSNKFVPILLRCIQCPQYYKITIICKQDPPHFPATSLLRRPGAPAEDVAPKKEKRVFLLCCHCIISTTSPAKAQRLAERRCEEVNFPGQRTKAGAEKLCVSDFFNCLRV
jgi:hypothetical protein